MMWKPTFDFITLHYLYIVLLGILSFIILYPNGNLSSTNAYFFGVSGSTESGLNVVDLNKMALYQQLTLFFIPILGNMQVVSIFIVMIRFHYFRKHLKTRANTALPHGAKTEPIRKAMDNIALPALQKQQIDLQPARSEGTGKPVAEAPAYAKGTFKQPSVSDSALCHPDNRRDSSAPRTSFNSSSPPSPTIGIRKARTDLPQCGDAPLSHVHSHVTFAPDIARPTRRSTAPPDASLSEEDEPDEDEKRGRRLSQLPDPLSPTRTRSIETLEAPHRPRQRRAPRGLSPDHISFHRVVSNVFVLGDSDPTTGHSHLGGRPLSRARSFEVGSRSRSRSAQRKQSAAERWKLSANAIIGRNSNFANLSEDDKDRLGGIEYRSLKLLLKVILGYYCSLHLIGIVCLLPWIHMTDNPKYRNYLEEQGINITWWAIFSAGTMSNNLGFTLTPDSMISFRDAVFPITVMTILAYAGHTFYPVCLRVLIWATSKIYNKDHKIQEPLHFLLDHPRRCYTLLFPGRPTWILAIILIILNIIDVILIICLDLDNPEITIVPLAPRFISSIFQAASSRHTGTSTFNLANVNPGVQFSLLVMMYVSIFPIAISVRSSNTYEESSLGVYQDDEDPGSLGEEGGKSYLKAHVRNQLSFDLWYIFLGCFCICCSEAERIMDAGDPAFNVFPIFFEVASSYGNVGLSLGHPRFEYKPFWPVRYIQQACDLCNDDKRQTQRFAGQARSSYHDPE